MSPKFQVYKDNSAKFRFRLRADNGKIVAVGEAYEAHASCLNGIKSIQKNCNSEIEDLTIEDAPKLTNPKFQIFKDSANEFRFHLKAANGEIIAESEGYETKESCLDGIEVVKKSCDAEIEDQAVVPKPDEEQKAAPAEPIKEEASKAKSAATPDRSKIVFIGNKTPMDYVMAILTGLSADNKEVTLKARGRAITTAVDAAEITRNRFLKTLKVSSISIATEPMPPRQGETRPRMVSAIEIVLSKE